MDLLSVPRFIISGIKKGVGKSILSVGLTVALRKRNVSLSCCVIGPDAAQAVVLRRLSRRYVRCLDTQILTHAQSLNCLSQAAVGADVVLLEGHDGLYDGESSGSLSGSDAEVAALTKSPVILVCDVRGFQNSLAALLHGYSAFASGFRIAGVIANRIAKSNSRLQYDRIAFDCALQKFGLASLLGAMPELAMNLPNLSNRFTQRVQDSALPLQFLLDVGQLVSQHVDLDGLLKRAAEAPAIKIPRLDVSPMNRRTRIGVSEDGCFSLCFQDNLELLRYYGAEVITFSPIADSELPKKLGAIYITGGSLDSYADDIEKNEGIRKAIAQFAGSGGVIYAEGGGCALLCDEFEVGEEQRNIPGVGLIPGKASRDTGAFSYFDGVLCEDSVVGSNGLTFKGVGTREWSITTKKQVMSALRVTYGSAAPLQEGYSPGAQSFATLTFPHWGSNPLIAKNIVDAAEIVVKL